MSNLDFIEAESLLGETVSGWTCEIEGFSGCLIWTNPKSETVLYGTPNWESAGDGCTPFEYTDEHGDYQSLLVLNYVDKKGDLESQKKYYLEILELILKNTKFIKNNNNL